MSRLVICKCVTCIHIKVTHMNSQGTGTVPSKCIAGYIMNPCHSGHLPLMPLISLISRGHPVAFFSGRSKHSQIPPPPPCDTLFSYLLMRKGSWSNRQHGTHLYQNPVQTCRLRRDSSSSLVFPSSSKHISPSNEFIQPDVYISFRALVPTSW